MTSTILKENKSKNKLSKISQNISTDIDNVLKGVFPNDTDVKLRNFTPQVLVSNEIPNYPMLINQNHIKSTILTEKEAKQRGIYKKNANYHGIGKHNFIKAIDSMDYPLAVIKSKKDNNKNWIIVTDVIDKDGCNIIVPVYLETKGTYNNVRIDTNKIKSLYGKRNLGKYIAAVYNQNNSNVVYFNVKKNSVATRSQSSNRNSCSFNNNISQSNNSVK